MKLQSLNSERRPSTIVLSFAMLFIVLAMSVASDRCAAQEDLEASCLLLVLDRVELAAQREGILEKLHARMGDSIKKSELVFELGLTEAKARLRVAEAKLAQAEIRTKDQSEIEAAKIELIRSAKELKLLEEVDKVPYLERFRAASTKSKSHAELDIARKTHEESLQAVQVAEAETQLAAIDLKERLIYSPVAGTVVKQYKHVGEWCNRGEPVLKVLRMDELMLQAIVNIREIAPHRIVGTRCTAQFELAGEKPIILSNLKITKANPEIDLDGNYIVWTNISNKQGIDAEGNPRWLLRPGISGSLRLHFDSTPGAPTTQSAVVRR